MYVSCIFNLKNLIVIEIALNMRIIDVKYSFFRHLTDESEISYVVALIFNQISLFLFPPAPFSR